jgi:hypothetical protein
MVQNWFHTHSARPFQALSKMAPKLKLVQPQKHSENNHLLNNQILMTNAY